MKIYLHCGYHKTGSSFLQMLFVQEREALKNRGIYYPPSESDRWAKEGKISPGNALPFAMALRKDDETLATAFLESRVMDMKKQQCEVLLLSSEGLFHDFARSEGLSLFERIATNVGFTEINALVFLREPADHILSLYKHRGKSGKILNFKNWLTTKYITFNETLSLIKNLDRSITNWTFRKYRKDSKFLGDAIFKDWLHLAAPAMPENDRVNRSLSLSEIILLRELRMKFGGTIVQNIQRDWNDLRSSSKPTDNNLEEYYLNIIIDYIQNYQSKIGLINQLLPSGEHLSIPSVKPTLDGTRREMYEEVTISLDQIDVALNHISKYNTLSYRFLEVAKNIYRKSKGLLKASL